MAAVLGFVGLKMVADFGGFHVSTEASLVGCCRILLLFLITFIEAHGASHVELNQPSQTDSNLC